MHPDPTAPDWHALDAALDYALDLADDERERYLATLDPALRDRLRPLLADALADDTLFDHPASALGDLVDADAPGPSGGDTIGRYELLDLVGEGGMGRVYRARRADGAFDQTVAIKVVRTALALAGSDVADRLHRERAVLATLDHPAIARLLDGGETPDGVPYLVTEFVDGAPITSWADAHGLDVPERVRLMIEVARAVDHAHRRFVVHRDLKPSNVLVTERDGVPRPVVLDFGIAKLLAEAEGGGTDGFPLTRTGLRLLTPAYAAPELFEPTATVTTAADVYGLGALLYELLTGRRPHDRLDGAAEPPTVEPTRPSKAVTQPAADATFDPAHRARLLRGDLDTICLKALHHDPGRRYGSAAAFAADLERHLEGRPVDARPDSVAYVVGRFARRNRAAVLAAAVALVALIGGFGMTLVALANERAARTEADEAADRASEAAALLGDLFRGADRGLTGGRVLTAREALDKGLARVHAVESPALRGYLLSTLGSIYLEISEYALADSLLTEAVRSMEASGANAKDLAEALYRLGRTEGTVTDLASAERHLRRAYAVATTVEGNEDVVFDITRHLSWVLNVGSRHDEALAWAERALRQARRGGDRQKICFALVEVGSTLGLLGRHDEAIPLLREMVRLTEQEFGPDHVATAEANAQLGSGLWRAGQWDEAEARRLQAADAFRGILGDDHHRTFESWKELGLINTDAGRAQRGEAFLDSAVTYARNHFGPDDTFRALIHWERARARNRMGAFVGAEADAREALRIAEASGDSILAADATAELQIARDAGRPFR